MAGSKARARRGGKSANTEPTPPGGRRLFELALVAAILSLIAAGAIFWFDKTGQILAYGDAEAHLNIARKLWDNYQPAYHEIGTVWLPRMIGALRRSIVTVNCFAGCRHTQPDARAMIAMPAPPSARRRDLALLSA